MVGGVQRTACPFLISQICPTHVLTLHLDSKRKHYKNMSELLTTSNNMGLELAPYMGQYKACSCLFHLTPK